jgi:hypothetical protein
MIVTTIAQRFNARFSDITRNQSMTPHQSLGVRLSLRERIKVRVRNYSRDRRELRFPSVKTLGYSL